MSLFRKREPNRPDYLLKCDRCGREEVFVIRIDQCGNDVAHDFEPAQGRAKCGGRYVFVREVPRT